MKEGKQRIALILTGGSTSATFEVGVLKELFKKIEPDFFIATSAGAATIGGILSHIGHKFQTLHEGAVLAEKVWRSLAKKKRFEERGKVWGINKSIFPLNKFILLGPFFANSIFTSSNYESFIKNLVGDSKIEDLPKPLYIGAISLSSGKTVFFDKGRLSTAIMASCAAAPFYPPYKIGEEYYIDGGLDVGSCIKKASDLGADKIIILGKNNEADFKNNLFGIIMKTVDVILTQHTDYYINNGFKEKIMRIEPPEKVSSDFNDFSKIDKTIKLGELAAKNFLKSCNINLR